MFSNEVIQQVASATEDRVNQQIYWFERVEQIALDDPGRTAIRTAQGDYSYSWLHTHSEILAHVLFAKSSGEPRKFVVIAEPSEHIFAALLAIHKVGGVYVPIDATFPDARIRDMLEEITPTAILFYGSRLPGLFSGSQFDIIDLEALFKPGRQVTCDVNYARPEISDTTVSHIFFTSGTTGKPKGVVATHGNLQHYLGSAVEKYAFDQRDTFLAVAKYTFSISLFELLVPLSVGASVLPVPRNHVLDMQRLSRYLESVTVFHIGPSLLKKVLPYIADNYSNFDVFAGMKHASSGGDHVPTEVLDGLQKVFGHAEVYVIYGSTEISCMGCTWLAPRSESIQRTYVGLPHKDTQIRVEDDAGRLVRQGESGEVLFASPGVVQGYLNRAGLTSEKFVVREGQRFYRTGDIGKQDSSGRLQLLGREDYQVQLHGIRIELLEIESVLKKYRSVSDCVVVGVRDGDQGETSLVAYLVRDELASFSMQGLLAYLAEYLPDYMVPSRFVGLERLPLNHNGKLDRSQLPKPTIINILTTHEYLEPRNELENTLVDLWQELLGVEGIGINHNFFELGGDSLKAVQMLGKISQQFPIVIPITSLLEYPTISGIAAIVTGDVSLPEMGNVTVLKPGDPARPPLFCLYGVFLYQDLADCLEIPNMVCGVYLQEEVDLIQQGVDSSAFKAFSSVPAITRKYVDCITRYQKTGPYYLCGESFGGIIALEAAKLLEQRGEVVNLIAMFDTNAPGFIENLGIMARLKIHGSLLRKRGIRYLKQGISHKLPGWLKRRSQYTPDKDLRINVRHLASRHYNPEFSNNVVQLFKARTRPLFEPESDDLGWGRRVKQVVVHEIEGDHIGILKGENVKDIAAILKNSF